MLKIFQLPVKVITNDFPEISYEAEGVANYWDIKSKEYDNEQSALDDIKAQLNKKFQKDADTWDEVEIEQEDVDLDDNEKLVTIEIEINLKGEE